MHVYEQSLTQANLEVELITQHSLFSFKESIAGRGQLVPGNSLPQNSKSIKSSQMVSNDLTTGRLNEIKRFGPGIDREMKKTKQSS